MEETIYSEEEVYKIQSEFEEELTNTTLPNSTSGKDIYVYRKIMLPWYRKLSLANRYQKDKIDGLRRDWVNYIRSIMSKNTNGYLWVELQYKDKQSSHKLDFEADVRTMNAIEDTFAMMIGGKAETQLAKARAMDVWGFDEKGNIIINKT